MRSAMDEWVQLTPTLPAPTTTTTMAPPTTVPIGLITEIPANSGSGRRVIYAKRAQRVWQVNADETVARTYRVSGRMDQPNPGDYRVWSRSTFTCSIGNSNTCMRFMVRFAHGPEGDNIGFHEIPRNNGRPAAERQPAGHPAVPRLRAPVDRRRRVDVGLRRHRHHRRRRCLTPDREPLPPELGSAGQLGSVTLGRPADAPSARPPGSTRTIVVGRRRRSRSPAVERLEHQHPPCAGARRPACRDGSGRRRGRRCRSSVRSTSPTTVGGAAQHARRRPRSAASRQPRGDTVQVVELALPGDLQVELHGRSPWTGCRPGRRRRGGRTRSYPRRRGRRTLRSVIRSTTPEASTEVDAVAGAVLVLGEHEEAGDQVAHRASAHRTRRRRRRPSRSPRTRRC